MQSPRNLVENEPLPVSNNRRERIRYTFEWVIWHLFFALLILVHIYLMALQSGLWTNNFDLSFFLSKSNVLLFILSVILAGAFMIAYEIYFAVYVELPMAGIGMVFAGFLLLIINALLKHVNVLPFYQMLFNWFA